MNEKEEKDDVQILDVDDKKATKDLIEKLPDYILSLPSQWNVITIVIAIIILISIVVVMLLGFVNAFIGAYAFYDFPFLGLSTITFQIYAGWVGMLSINMFCGLFGLMILLGNVGIVIFAVYCFAAGLVDLVLMIIGGVWWIQAGSSATNDFKYHVIYIIISFILTVLMLILDIVIFFVKRNGAIELGKKLKTVLKPKI
jgi:hypothetical protein